MMNFKRTKKIFLIVILVITIFIGGQIKAEESNGFVEKEKFEYAQSAIKQKAEDVAKQIEIYIKLNPDKTINDLQNDPYFQEIAVQPVGKTGYTAISDQNTSEQYFTPQKEIIGKKLEDFKDQIPLLWDFFEKELLGQCNDRGIFYDWPDSDGELRKKYSYSVCIKTKTADGKILGVDASTYLSEYENINDITQKQETFEELSIRLKALQTAKEIEAYLLEHSDMTIADLQNDLAFKSIAIQTVGQTGYTYVNGARTGIFYFHPNKKLLGKHINITQKDYPAIWGISNELVQSDPCQDTSGFYKFEDSLGKIRDKYVYHKCISVKTADGVELYIGASTYLDEYNEPREVNVSAYKSSIKSRDDLLHLAQEASRSIEIVVNGFNRDIRSLSQIGNIQKLLNQVKEEGILIDTETEKKYYPKDKEKYWNNLQEYFQRFYQQNVEEIDIVRLFYKNGYIVNGVILGEEDVNDYKGDKSWFKDVMDPLIVKNGAIYVSPINVARLTNSPAIRYAVPIDIDGERLGLIIINFKAKAIYKAFNNENNILFLDKVYKNAEGDINNDWVVTLADSRQPDYVLSEYRADAFPIKSSQIIGNNGYLEFLEDKQEWIGAYQKVNIAGKEWYVVSFNQAEKIEENKILEQNINQISSVSFVSYIYWFLGGLAFIFLVLGLLYYLKIIKLERTALLIIMIFIFILISGLFIFGSYFTVKKLKTHFKNSYIEQYLQLENLLSGEVVELIDDMNLELDLLSKIVINENPNKESCSNLLKGVYNRNKEYAHAVYRINKDSVIENMYPIDKTSIGADLSDQAHMKKIRETLKPVFSDIFDAVEGFQGVTLHYPIIKDGQYDGTVAFLINIDNFFHIISPFSNHIHEHESFLLDAKGQIIVSDYEDYVGKNIFMLEKHQIAKNNYENILMSDKAGYDEFVLEKEKQISTYVPIKIQDNKWVMVINGREEDAYYGISSTLNSIWLFTLMALISFVIFGALFSNFLTRSLRKEVEIKTVDIKNQSSKIREQLKKEELITREKEKLLNEQKQAKKELEEKIKEMEKFQKLTVDRELKMIELKKEIKKLKD